MKKSAEPELAPMEMIAVLAPLVQLVDIGIKNGKTPKEVVEYAIELFNEFNQNMHKIEDE